MLFEHAEATIRRTPVELWDRAHNLLLDTWLTGGLIGVAAVVLALILAGKSALSARASAPGNPCRPPLSRPLLSMSSRWRSLSRR